jgi:transposase
MGCEPDLLCGRPCDLPGCAASTNPSLSFCPPGLPPTIIEEGGSAEARHTLCEAAWVAVRTPGPLRAFYERIRARRGAQIALVATARKLSVLFWHLLTREEDYAFGRPSLTRRKLRALELKTEEGWRSGRY